LPFNLHALTCKQAATREHLDSDVLLHTKPLAIGLVFSRPAGCFPLRVFCSPRFIYRQRRQLPASDRSCRFRDAPPHFSEERCSWCIEARLQRISDERLGRSVARASDLPELFGPSFHLLVKEPKPNVQPPRLSTLRLPAEPGNPKTPRLRPETSKFQACLPSAHPDSARTHPAPKNLPATRRPGRASDGLTFDSPVVTPLSGSTEAPPDDQAPTSSSQAAVRTHPSSDTSCNLRRSCRPHPDFGASTRLTLRAPLRTPSTNPQKDPLLVSVTRHIEPVTLRAPLRTPSTNPRKDPLLVSAARHIEPLTTHHLGPNTLGTSEETPSRARSSAAWR
jgi:hypothetical protein